MEVLMLLFLWQAWFVMGALKRVGLLKAFPLNSDTFVDHTFWCGSHPPSLL
jgi:hypothetical protein